MVNDLFCKPQDLYLYNKVCQKIGLFLFIYSPSEAGFSASFFLADLFSRPEMVLPRNYFRFWEEIFLGINFPVQKYFRAEISSIWITFLAGLFFARKQGHFVAATFHGRKIDKKGLLKNRPLDWYLMNDWIEIEKDVAGNILFLSTDARAALTADVK